MARSVVGSFVASMVVLGIVLAAPTAHAAPRKYTNDLYFTGYNFQLGGGGSSLYAGSMLGLGYRLNGMFAGQKAMGWGLGFDYSKGMVKEDFTGSLTSSTTRLEPSAYALYFQGDHYYDCCDFDCGPEIYYSNSTLLEKQTGFPDDKLKNVQTYGLGGHFGGQFALSPKIGAFGEYSEIFGYRTFKETNPTSTLKYTAWSFEPHYRAGFRFDM
jgi:hypothetical protein